MTVAETYFAAYNRGNIEAVLELFEPDATYADNFGSVSRADWEMRLAWDTAQGTTLSTPDCWVDEEPSGGPVTLVCPHDQLDALVQAVGAEPVPIRLTLVVTTEGIRDWIWIFGDPPFKHVARPFIVWVSVNHPEDLDAVGFENWTTAQEAKENGLLTAEYAAEWAANLEENGCSYDDDC